MRAARWSIFPLVIRLCSGDLLPAQSLQVDIPPSLILVNYDRMSIGSREGLEAGAFVARTNDAGANWYNPAGLSRSEKSALNAAGTAYEWSRVSLDGLGEKTTGSRLKSVTTFFAGVVGAPVISSDRWRLGFSVTTPISWSPGVLDPTFTTQSAGGSQVLGYYSELDFSQLIPAVAVGYAPGGPARFGVSLGGSVTSMRQLQSASFRSASPSSSILTNRSFTTDGTSIGVIASAGFLYDFSEDVKFGLRIVSPSMRLGGTSRIGYQASLVQGVTAADVYYQDREATFDYKYPVEIDGGIAVNFGRAELEIDVKYHGKVAEYSLYTSGSMSRNTTTDSSGVPTVTYAPFADVKNSALDVVNLAIGGNYAFDSTFALHAGFRTDLAPIADGQATIFRKVNLYGGTLGMTVTWVHLSGSLGLAYSTGISEDRPIRTVSGPTITTSLGVSTLQIIFAISYGF